MGSVAAHLVSEHGAPSGNLLVVGQRNGMAHFVTGGIHLCWGVSRIAHRAAHCDKPSFQQCTRPLHVPLLVPEAQDARDVVRVVLLVTHGLQCDTPRPAHPDDSTRPGMVKIVFTLVLFWDTASM